MTEDLSPGKNRHRKYIILEGLAERNRFFSGNSSFDDPTKLLDGTVAYRIIGYADTIAEAQIKLYGRSFTKSTE